MTTLVTLPNGRLAALDANNYLTTEVVVSLSDIIDNDNEGFLDLLCDKAVGTVAFSDISYTVTGHTGDDLHVSVRGCLDEPEDFDTVELANLPMRPFEVEVTRVSYGVRTLTVEARTAAEAQERADDEAGDHLYSEHASDYQFDVQTADEIPA